MIFMKTGDDEILASAATRACKDGVSIRKEISAVHGCKETVSKRKEIGTDRRIIHTIIARVRLLYNKVGKFVVCRNC